MQLNRFPENTGFARSGFFVGENPVTSEEAIKLAKLDWNVTKEDLFYGNVSMGHCKDDEYKAIVRSDNNQRLGIVKNSYTPIQNIDAFKFMDTLAFNGDICYHSAGTFQNGQRIWMLAKIGESEILPSDMLENYILLYNSHNGSSSLKAVLTSIRMVCTNAIIGMLRAGEKIGINIRHTVNALLNLDLAKDILIESRDKASKIIDLSKYLTKIKITDDKFKEITKELVPDPINQLSQKSHHNVERTRSTLVQLFSEGQGQSISGVAGTGWAAINAITEYVNHSKPTRSNDKEVKRLESSLFGPSAKLITKATNLILAA